MKKVLTLIVMVAMIVGLALVPGTGVKEATVQATNPGVNITVLQNDDTPVQNAKVEVYENGPFYWRWITVGYTGADGKLIASLADKQWKGLRVHPPAGEKGLYYENANWKPNGIATTVRLTCLKLTVKVMGKPESNVPAEVYENGPFYWRWNSMGSTDGNGQVYYWLPNRYPWKFRVNLLGQWCVSSTYTPAPTSITVNLNVNWTTP